MVKIPVYTMPLGCTPSKMFSIRRKTFNLPERGHKNRISKARSLNFWAQFGHKSDLPQKEAV